MVPLHGSSALTDHPNGLTVLQFSSDEWLVGYSRMPWAMAVSLQIPDNYRTALPASWLGVATLFAAMQLHT